MKKRVVDLTPQEVLALGIQVEISNGRRLRNFSHIFHGYDDEVSARFMELAVEEDQHEKMLKDRWAARFGGPIPVMNEFDVVEIVEAVELEDSEAQIFDSLREAQVFQIALTAELNASRLYTEAAKVTKDPELKALFAELGGMEDDHVGWLQKRIAAAETKGKGAGKGKAS